MANEEGLIRILNYGEHPTNSLYLVFHFVDDEHANYFKQLLNEKNIWFEYALDDETDVVRHLFANKKTNRKEALRCNYLVKGKYRNKLIPNKLLRWTLLLTVAAIFVLLVLGIINNN